MIQNWELLPNGTTPEKKGVIVGDAPKKKPETAKQKKQWLWEFSKRIVVFVAIFFFVMTVYSLIFLFIHPDSMAINGIFTDVSNVFKWTVVAYAVKAGFENVIKIKQSHEEEEE